MKSVHPRTILAGVALAVGILSGPSAMAAELARAFDDAPSALVNVSDTPQWSRVRTHAAREMAAPDDDRCTAAAAQARQTRKGADEEGADCRLADWTRKLALSVTLSPQRRMAWVHRTINALPYVSDRTNWGVADHWESPAEMFARGGDCEGFALTKYFSLRAAGFAEESLRVAVVWDTVDREEHAILLVRLDGEDWFLDNKMDAPERVADHQGRYRLIYHLNAFGVRLPSQPGTFQRTSVPRVRLTDGGRTLVMQVRPRTPGQVSRDVPRRRVDAIMPAGG